MGPTWPEKCQVFDRKGWGSTVAGLLGPPMKCHQLRWKCRYFKTARCSSKTGGYDMHNLGLPSHEWGRIWRIGCRSFGKRMCDPKLSNPLIFNSVSEFLIGQEPGNPHFSQSCHDKGNYIKTEANKYFSNLSRGPTTQDPIMDYLYDTRHL